MKLTARVGTLACALALLGCGGASHTPDGGTDGVDASTHHDGGPRDGGAQDGGAAQDSGAGHDGGETRDGGATHHDGAVHHDSGSSEESCASIEARYAQVIESKSSCEQATDCRITAGHCGAGLGGCWYAVSGDVSELDALAERYRDLGCTTTVCRCAPPPESATCEDGRCAFP